MENYEVFAEHIGFDLRVVFKAASGAIQELLFFVDDEEAFLANGVSTVEVAGAFLFGIIEVIAHGAFHLVYYLNNKVQDNKVDSC